MHAGRETTPRHELILGRHERREDISTLSANERLRIACKDASPSLDRTRNSQRINEIKNLLKAGADSAEVDENGCNALMLLFEHYRNYRPEQSIGLESDSASKGLRPDKVPVTEVNYVYSDGQMVFEDAQKERYDKVLQGAGFANLRTMTTPDPDALSAYESELREKIKSYKLEIAREIIPLLSANINTRNKDGASALVIAHQAEDRIFEQVLLENGANEFDLKVALPEYKYLTDQTDPRNFARNGCNFEQFAAVLIDGVKNKMADNQKYPQVVLNKDNSVSLIFLDENAFNNIDKYRQEEVLEEIKLQDFLQQDYVIEQFKFQAQKNGLKILDEKDQPLEIIPSLDCVECRLNFSPDDLDVIMKMNDKYTGYRNEGSILKLNKDFVMPEGAIRIFPVFAIDESAGSFSVQAAGCQVSEMPTIQLMRLLPNYESEIAPDRKANGGYFHWVPDEIKDGLLLRSSDVSKVLNKIFSDNGIFVNDRGDQRAFSQYPDLLTIQDASKQKDVRIVAMDNDSKDFYAMYGNCSVAELTNCKSVEIKTSALLQAISDHLNNSQEISGFTSEQIVQAKSNIESMLREQKLKEQKQDPSSTLRNARATKVVSQEQCCTIS